MLRCRTVLIAALGVALAAGCSTSSNQTKPTDGPLLVVAAEDVWGSLAAQLGGNRVNVKTLVSNPDADPHDYEPTPADGRAIAKAGYVITNGIGYDPWAAKLVDANPKAARAALDVGTLIGAPRDANPHQWYSPQTVDKVIERITADFKRLRPTDSGYFDEQRAALDTNGLAEYHGIIAAIRAAHAGKAVAATESIFAPLAVALGVRLVTPPAFLEAISEGTEPTAADKAAVDQQIATKSIKALVVNSQNSTPDVQRLVSAARANGIGVTTVTETITPPGATFQAWQTRQLRELQAVLAASP